MNQPPSIPKNRHSFRPLLFAPPQGPDALPKTLPPPPRAFRRRPTAPAGRNRSSPPTTRTFGCARCSLPLPRATEIEYLDAQDLLDELCEDQLTMSMNLACLEELVAASAARCSGARCAAHARGTARRSRCAARRARERAALDRRLRVSSALAVPGLTARRLPARDLRVGACRRARARSPRQEPARAPDWALLRWRIEEAKNFHFDELHEPIRADLLRVHHRRERRVVRREPSADRGAPVRGGAADRDGGRPRRAPRRALRLRPRHRRQPARCALQAPRARPMLPRMATMVHEVLAETVAKHGSRPALRVKRDGAWKTITWSAYGRDARRAARALMKLGVQPGKGVSFIGQNSPEWLVADVGAILAGAMPAGIYTTNSAEQVRYITDHCEAKVVVRRHRGAGREVRRREGPHAAPRGRRADGGQARVRRGRGREAAHPRMGRVPRARRRRSGGRARGAHEGAEARRRVHAHLHVGHDR